MLTFLYWKVILLILISIFKHPLYFIHVDKVLGPRPLLMRPYFRRLWDLQYILIKTCIVSEENVYAIVPLANEYQVERLLKLGEKVLEETIRRRWEKPNANGEEACKQMYRHIIIADTCNLKGLKKLCVNIAADASSSERERTMADHPIPTDLDIEINKLAVRKHELLAADAAKKPWIADLLLRTWWLFIWCYTSSIRTRQKSGLWNQSTGRNFGINNNALPATCKCISSL